MVKILGAIVSLVIAFFLYRIHWVLGYAVVLGLLAWAITLAPEKWRRQAIIGHIALTGTAYIGTAAQIVIARSATIQNLSQTRLLALLGIPLMQYLLAALTGAIISIILLYGVLWLSWLVSAEFVLHLSPDLGISRGQAISTLRGLFLQSNAPSMIIENGQVVERGKQGWFRFLRGPGLLIVRPHHAVVLDQGNGESRIAGPGTLSIKTLETVQAIVDLRQQKETRSFGHVLTRDRIPLEFELEVAFRIEPKADTDRRDDALFERKHFGPTVNDQPAVYEETIRRAVSHAPDGNWKQHTLTQVGTALRAVIASYDLDQLLHHLGADRAAAPFPASPPDTKSAAPTSTTTALETKSDPLSESAKLTAALTRLAQAKLPDTQSAAKAVTIEQLEKQILHRIAETTIKWGIKIDWCEIAKMVVPPNVADTILELWKKRWEVDMAAQDAFKDEYAKDSRLDYLRRVLAILRDSTDNLELEKIIQYLVPLMLPPEAAAKLLAESTKGKKTDKDGGNGGSDASSNEESK